MIFIGPIQSVTGQEASHDFSIERGTLEQVLSQLAATAGLAISLKADTLAASQIDAIEGRLTIDEALDQALAGTGLGYRRTGDARIVIYKRQTDDSVDFQLDPLTIQGEREMADGPVEGYRARRSATATATDAAVRDLPVSIQVVGRDLIQDQQKENLGEVLQTVSGVTSAEGSTLIESRESVIARGFRSRSVYYDRFRVSAIPSADLGGIERVEVLKGPSSILFGQVEPGGVVNLVPVSPGRENTGELSVAAGEFSRRRLDANGTLASEDGTTAGRVNAAYEDSDSFRDRINVERSMIMPTLRSQFGDSVSAEIGLIRYREERPFDEGVAFTADGQPLGDESTFLGGPDLAGSDFEWDAIRANLEWEPSERFRVRTGIFHQRFRHDWEAFRPQGNPGESPLERGQLAVLTDSSLNEVPSRPVGEDELFRFYDNASLAVDTTEVRLDAVYEAAFAGASHELVAGVDYRNQERDISETRGLDLVDESTGEFLPQKINIRNPTFDAPIPQQFVEDGFLDGTQEELGAFIQNRIEAGERNQWHLLAGLRYDRIDQQARSDRAQDKLQSRITGEETFDRFDDRDEEVTGRIGLLYRPFEPLGLFASYSESIAATGIKESGDSDELLAPTEGEQVEFGIKATGFNDRLSGTLSAFRIDRNNVPVIDPDDQTRFVNGGLQRSKGLELDLAGNPLPQWRLQASATYIDAEVRKSSTLEKGTPLRNVPEYSASLATRYRFNQGWVRGVEVSGHVVTVDDRPGDDQNGFRLPSHTVASVFVSRDWALGDQSLKTRFGVKNLADKTHYLASNAKSSVVPGRPRTVLGTVTLEF